MKRLFADIGLITGKDLKIELRSRVLTNQVAPFALMILVLFGIALDADQQSLRNFASGLFWISVLLCALMAISRSMTIERDDEALVVERIDGAGLADLSDLALRALAHPGLHRRFAVPSGDEMPDDGDDGEAREDDEGGQQFPSRPMGTGS